MAIPYSLALRLAKPGFPEKGNKTYPVAQYYQLLDLGKMAAHMAGHASKYSKGDIMAVTTELTSCIREQLLLGNKIQLGDLGAFSVTLISKGADNAESFSTSLIQKVKVHWEPSAEFTDLLNDCEFEFVGTREAQAAARKADKANPTRESSGSQFYIVHDAGTCAQLDGQYTIFGETLEGLEVIDAIAAEPVTAPKNAPVNPIKIISVMPAE